jgi:L-lactate dehydrogenase (cytochrome)/glycolate oxidase
MANESKTASRIASVADARYFASRRVPKGLFQFFESGCGARITVERNAKAFEDVMFRPRVAVFHPSRELSTTVLGHEISMPIVVSSVGVLSVGHVHGEAGVARAAAAAGTMLFLSGFSGTPIEVIMENRKGPVFYQLYYFGGRDASAPIIERVKRAGVDGLVLTVDGSSPIGPDIPYRERGVVPTNFKLRELLRFAPDALARPSWLFDYLRAGKLEPKVAMALRPDGEPMGPFEATASMSMETPTWDDIPWIRKRWDGPLVIKGVMTVEDARRAVDEGADAIVVSNHGGNMLDRDIPTLPALPEIVDAVGDRAEVLLDGGVRRGSDVVMALALGAKAVGIGRAYVYPFLAAGAPGVERILELFRNEIDSTLGCLGVQSIHDLNRSYLELPPQWRRIDH